ncbi:MAG: OmpA family protein [Candidatus Latescibacterota bacterium]|nr:MAG: OmpA family protein [Candidatus Latescibacterota bacterium]
MRCVFTLLLIVLLVPVLAVEAVDAGCDKDCKGKCCKKKTDKEITEFIYDATIPWPFRKKVKGDADFDGVLDELDKCPDTPKGAIVDENGCPMDSDGDGVYDGIDKCPDTPEGAVVDEVGCPLDSDKDGIYDGLDQCPDTPKKAKVDFNGCPLDSDSDGVYDGIDKCADTPKGAKVDKKGCALDSDGDGVPDGIDRCPNTPEGVEVDEYGCTEMETDILDTGKYVTSNILFEIDKSDIKPESYPVLDDIGQVLVQWPELKIEIGGHTDNTGSDAYNQELSERRAKAVLDYLVEKFPDIEKGQFTTKGYGEGNPIATNDDREGRAKNRRVEFTVLNKEVLKRERVKKK